MASKILIVEDNYSVASLLKDAFEQAGYEAIVVDSAGPAARVFDGSPFDLVILDVMLKEGTGYDVCRHIRAHASRSSTPVIMLTANSSPEQKAMGFESGADNYLIKPINVAEVMLWVKALLRRATGNWSQEAVISTGDLNINSDTHCVESGGRLVRGLTSMEFKLLCELARARPRVVPRHMLEERVWRENCRTNTLDVHIKNLRQKLGPQGAIHIITVKGLGYRFE